MLVVDPASRSSLDEVASNPWLKDDTSLLSSQQSIPPFSAIEDIPEDIVEIVLSRLELGGYGGHSLILRSVVTLFTTVNARVTLYMYR